MDWGTMNYDEFLKGTAFDAYTYFGAHVESDGVSFRVYAPNAKDVKLIGDFPGWEEYNMYPCEYRGVWHAYIKCAKAGQLYK